MRAHPAEVKAVVASPQPGEFERFFFSQFCAMMRSIVAELTEGETIAEDIKRKVIRHFAVTVLGYFTHWLATGMKEDPAALVPEIEFLLRGQVSAALESLTQWGS